MGTVSIALVCIFLSLDCLASRARQLTIVHVLHINIKLLLTASESLDLSIFYTFCRFSERKACSIALSWMVFDILRNRDIYIVSKLT